MRTLKRLHQMFCGCGKAVANGSVFCPNCKAAIERANAKVICDENLVFRKMTKKTK